MVIKILPDLDHSVKRYLPDMVRVQVPCHHTMDQKVQEDARLSLTAKKSI